MTTDVLSNAALTTWPIIGLVMFVAVFVGVSIWVASRSKGEVDHWSTIPLGEEK
jgi:hypothetical protein